MNIRHAASSNRLLPPDFAPRVVERVSQIKHRRRLRRRTLAVTGVMALALGAFLAERHQSVAPLEPAVALQPSPTGNGTLNRSNGEPVSYQLQPQTPVLYQPDTYLMNNFEDSNGDSSWHSYDSWWGSNS